MFDVIFRVAYSTFKLDEKWNNREINPKTFAHFGIQYGKLWGLLWGQKGLFVVSSETFNKFLQLKFGIPLAGSGY